MGGTNEPEGSWRAELANKLSVATVVAFSFAVLISYVSTSMSPRIATLTHVVFLPLLGLVLLERVIAPRDYRLRAVLPILALALAGVGSSVFVGLLGGTASALFLSLILTSLLFGMRAMIGLLVLEVTSVTTIAWLMVSGRIAAPLEADVTFANAATWARSASNALILVGVGAVVTAHVVNRLERALARVRSEAAELARAQEARTRALELAMQAQKVEVVGRLAAGLAHDLNNALFVIDACNQMLQRRKLTDTERAETHTAIADAVKQSSAMARQLLSFGRKHVVSAEPVTTTELVAELQRSLPRVFPADMRVIIASDADATVRVDRVHLQQAILNLAINARDAMASGGQLTVRLATEHVATPKPALGGAIEPGHYVTCEVRDTGSGMDAATAARAFEPLFTTKPEGKGTGLGLASVQSIVEMSGGYVTLWTELGRGTAITLYLPSVEGQPRTVHAATDAEVALDLHGTTVLLAEDAPDVRGVISSSLARHGCAVLQARDGTDALRQIERAASIDVLCTDAVMPGAPVRDVIAKLLQKHPRASVVVISGYVNDELTRRGIEQGHYRVLAKPFEPSRLLETIDELRRAPVRRHGSFHPMA